jgi:hypothetical protein
MRHPLLRALAASVRAHGCPHLHRDRDWARAHVIGTGLTAVQICTGTPAPPCCAAAPYPARHGITQGTLSRAAQSGARAVTGTPWYSARDGVGSHRFFRTGPSRWCGAAFRSTRHSSTATHALPSSGHCGVRATRNPQPASCSVRSATLPLRILPLSFRLGSAESFRLVPNSPPPPPRVPLQRSGCGSGGCSEYSHCALWSAGPGRVL